MTTLLDHLYAIGEFLVVTVILKAIVAHWLAEKFLQYGKVMFARTERQAVIWTHYQENHKATTPRTCSQGDCAVI